MIRLFLSSAVCIAALVPAVASAQDLTIYSGRGESFVAPVLAMFEAETGIDVEVRYAGTSELATLLKEEGANSPADVFWAQDGGALGATAELFAEVPAALRETPLAVYRDPNNRWIGTSARARVFVYSAERVAEDARPNSVTDLTGDAYRGKVGWAPTNGSFQAFVTALRVAEGEEAAKAWIDGMVANDAKTYRNNTALVQAVADGEIDIALVNNYYLNRFKTRDADFPAEQSFFADGDIGNLLNVAGIGILETSDNKEEAARLGEFLLSPAVQQYFTSVGAEFPVTAGVIPNATLAELGDIDEAAPDVPVGELSDLEGTLELLRSANLL